MIVCRSCQQSFYDCSIVYELLLWPDADDNLESISDNDGDEDCIPDNRIVNAIRCRRWRW